MRSDDVTAAAVPVELGENPLPRLAVLRCPAPGAMGQVFKLGRTGTTIGRGEGVTVRLDDPGISRTHARITPLGNGTFEIVDLDSRNGTYVNGQRITRHVLQEGDRIQIGSLSVLRFSRSTAEPARMDQALTAAGIALWDWSLAEHRLIGAFNLDAALGFPSSRIAGSVEELAQLVDPEDRERVLQRFEALIRNGERLELELRLAETQPPRWISLQAELRKGEKGEPLGLSGTALDVTARKRVEQELRRQGLILESLYDAVVLSDLQGRITDWNSSAERTFGREREAVLGRTLAEVLAPRLSAPIALTEAGEDKAWHGEISFRRDDGTGGTCDAVSVALRDETGQPVAHLTAFRDVSDKREMQARLLLADRMASVGTLAAGVAHEVNNPLAFIRANLSYLGEALTALAAKADEETVGEIRQVLSETHEGVRRIEGVIRDLKTFSNRDDKREIGPVNLHGTIAFAAKMVGNQVRHRAQLLVESPDPLWVLGNEAQLAQVFVSLLVHAAQSIPVGDASHHAVCVIAVREADGMVSVKVRDTGAGMPPEVRARIFSPFFVTKHLGEGTGLALSVSHAIVTSFGGEIAVESHVGCGSTFTVRLHATDPRDVELPAVSPRAAQAGAKRRRQVLVVDDDRFVASAIRRALSHHHEVTLVNSGREALRVLGTRKFDAILCDVMMPEMTGMELHEALLLSQPDVVPRMVFLTGGAFTEKAEAFITHVANPVLRKPFANDDLLAAVERAAELFPLPGRSPSE